MVAEGPLTDLLSGAHANRTIHRKRSAWRMCSPPQIATEACSAPAWGTDRVQIGRPRRAPQARHSMTEGNCYLPVNRRRLSPSNQLSTWTGSVSRTCQLPGRAWSQASTCAACIRQAQQPISRFRFQGWNLPRPDQVGFCWQSDSNDRQPCRCG